MTTFLIIEIATGIGLIVVLAHLVKGWEERERYPENLLCSLRESELCDDMHEWEQAVFLNPSELAQVRDNPKLLDKMKTSFCVKCGFIPVFRKTVKPAHLQRLRTDLAYTKAVKWKIAQIEELEEQFWKGRLKTLPDNVTASERIYFKMGYYAHSQFVDELPQLVAQLNTEASASLETPGSLPDASSVQLT